jgi:hypothetical protein
MEPAHNNWFRNNRATVILAAITLLVLVLSAPSSMRNAFERGQFYLFSWEFIEDIPKRFTSPGRFRFVLQPLTAIFLGIRSGLRDVRLGRPPYVYGILLDRSQKGALLRSGFDSVINLLLMAVLLDAIFQWIILGASYPGAALVVGPMLILLPYTLARGISNRIAHHRKAQLDPERGM